MNDKQAVYYTRMINKQFITLELLQGDDCCSICGKHIEHGEFYARMPNYPEKVQHVPHCPTSIELPDYVTIDIH